MFYQVASGASACQNICVHRPKSSPRIQRDTLQRFVYEDGYIASSSNSSLVLGTTQQEGRVSEVVLVKRRPDDISQLWVIAPNG